MVQRVLSENEDGLSLEDQGVSIISLEYPRGDHVYIGIPVCILLPLTTCWSTPVSQPLVCFSSPLLFFEAGSSTAQAGLEPSDPPVSTQMCVTSPVLCNVGDFELRALCRQPAKLHSQSASFLHKVGSPSVTQTLAQGIILHQLPKRLELHVPVSIHSCRFYLFIYFFYSHCLGTLL